MARSFLPLLLGLLILVAAAEAHDKQLHFVLVHGLGHGAWCWYKTTTLLQQAGHQVTAIDLTSNGISKVVADTVTSLAMYLQPLTQFLANEVQAPNKVILVGHSLGGIGITYAMELFSEKVDKAIFLAASMPSNNETYFAGAPASFLIQNFANGPSMPPTSLAFNLTLARDILYNESPLEDVNLAKALLNPTPSFPSTDVLTLTPNKYGSINRFYIRTEFDHAIPLSNQDSIIQNNPPHEVFFIKQSDHSPFFSKPSILNSLLLSIASK